MMPVDKYIVKFNEEYCDKYFELGGSDAKMKLSYKLNDPYKTDFEKYVEDNKGEVNSYCSMMPLSIITMPKYATTGLVKKAYVDNLEKDMPINPYIKENPIPFAMKKVINPINC